MCPRHGARYDVVSGRMRRGPRGGGLARIPGADDSYHLLTRLWPLRRGEIIDREGALYVR